MPGLGSAPGRLRPRASIAEEAGKPQRSSRDAVPVVEAGKPRKRLRHPRVAHRKRPGSGLPASCNWGNRPDLPISPWIVTLSEAFRAIEINALAEDYRQALGAWLSDCFLFTHFVTLTLRDLERSDGSRIPPGSISLARRWREFCRLGRILTGHRLEWFLVKEYQKRGVPHIHALIVNGVELYGRERELRSLCWEAFGIVQILRYLTRLGAAGYLTKYLLKDSRVEVETSQGLWQYYRTIALKGSEPLCDTATTQADCPITNDRLRYGRKTVNRYM